MSTTATMEVFMTKTKTLDDNVSEQVRLEDQHETVIHAMGGKPLFAPVDLSRPGLKVLDSGCANGRWLKDLQAASSAEHEYVGTDVVESLYPKPPPKNTQFFDQSIKESWPKEWARTFDVIHQKLVMAAALPEQNTSSVVNSFAGLLAPAGWLQMVEVDTEPLVNNGKAQNQYIEMLDTLYNKLGYGKSRIFADLPSEMEKAGLINVEKKDVLVKYGAAVKDDEDIGVKSLRTAVAGVPNFLSVLKAMPDAWREEWDDLQERLKQELAERGGQMKYIVCWGQKPSP
ncbi:hypothetical protein M409DRAFT_30866 [Zasmidium cellare ATCC 36951]|uniref:Methyltransferase domain-containing protein n=1 Tax=Zasmidium cellare ATCC 36951 TaxID=1080233 RepID=A0A6A6BV63_ZASCE|nr:uncharacterized protein M409DRAFT_30866 [Zasmidium cellare ATCC 36951]KAF2158641.1 hypothetical protein M409DRAFT_30866 [Zasmidium cellare ATCC 36951]